MQPNPRHIQSTPPRAVAGTVSCHLPMRLIAVKLWTVALIVALGVVLSGCMPGRAGMAHNYDSPYGYGTVYYEGNTPHHKPPKPPKKKKKKPKPPKKSKHHKHHDD